MKGRGICPGMAGRGRGSPVLPNRGGAGVGRDGGSAGAERRLPTAPAWRSGGVCAERAKRGRRAVRRERIPGKGEERKGNSEKGNSEGTSRLGLGGGGSLGSSILSPSPVRAPRSLCAALPLARPVRLGLSLPSPPSVAHTQTKWRLLFLRSPEPSEGSGGGGSGRK